MKTLLSKFVLGVVLVSALGGCAGLGTTPMTDAELFGRTADIPL